MFWMKASDGDDSCAPELFEPAHRSQSGLQPSVIGFDRIISVLLGDMASGGHQLVEYPRVGGRVISGDINRGRPVFQGAGEESPGGRQIPLLGDQHIEDLPVLVDDPVQIHPPPGDLGVGLIREPAISGRMSTRSCCVDQQGCAVLHPPEDADVINGDASFGQQFFHVSVGEPVAEVPANRNHDHIRRKAKPGEAGPRC